MTNAGQAVSFKIWAKVFLRGFSPEAGQWGRSVLDWPMAYIADLHVHSRYAYSTSKNLSLDSLTTWAKLKGIDLLASADFTHPAWLEELRRGLTPAIPGSTISGSKVGLYQSNGVHFVLGTEVSCVYRQGSRSKRLHLLMFAPDFEAVDAINKRLAPLGRLDSDGRPTLKISARDLVSLVLDCNDQCFFIPAHVWTPWYGVLGSKTGYDSLEDCFQDMYPQIHAIETGLSSDPAMNWQVPEMAGKSIVSFSDAHSAARLGREATAFEGEMSYSGLAEALENRRIAYTVEFYAEEGKYHYSGHRKCGVSLGPEETLGSSGRCPQCGRQLTLGVLHRLLELSGGADAASVLAGNPASGSAAAVDGVANRPPFFRLTPLQGIMAQCMGVGESSKKVQAEYLRIVPQVGGEIRALTQATLEELTIACGEPLARLIIRARNGGVSVVPGYDGVYGRVRVLTDEEADVAGISR